MDGVAPASTQNATTRLQLAAQIDVLKKAMDSDKDMAARLLGGAQGDTGSAQAGPAAAINPQGIGQLIDRRA